MQEGTGNICSHCQDDIEKAETKKQPRKVAKSLIPYNTVKVYEREFKADFGKTIGDMGSHLMRLLNSYVQ